MKNVVDFPIDEPHSVVNEYREAYWMLLEEEQPTELPNKARESTYSYERTDTNDTGSCWITNPGTEKAPGQDEHGTGRGQPEQPATHVE